jgi:hypothetical protein
MPAFAFSLPLLPGQDEMVRQLCEVVSDGGPLRSAYEASRLGLGISEEKVWIQLTPIGKTIIIYWETDDPQRVLREMANSQDRFDSQFRQFIESAAPALNLSKDKPLSNELLFEWSES